MKELLTIGVMGKSLKENEKRVAIHPDHIRGISERIRKQITFEEGYGLIFGMDDEKIAELSSGKVATREEILGDFDIVLIPKPLGEDLEQLKEGTIVWGWSHCVQQEEVTQISIERKLTLIAWEEMFKWNSFDDKEIHIFHKNNEMAGYAGVNHALSLIGTSGHYGEPIKAAILSFGSVSRGAIRALQGQGIQDIVVYTERPSIEVKDQILGVTFKQMKNDESGNLIAIDSDGTTKSFSDALSDVKIIVNGTLQDVKNPKNFVTKEESHKLLKGTIIIDISCDEGMGFWCAKPTTFDNPIIEVEGKFYYSVDHSPSFYWNSASWEISKALIPFLPEVIGGSKVWDKNKTILKSIEIDNGVIQNHKIISYQKR